MNKTLILIFFSIQTILMAQFSERKLSVENGNSKIQEKTDGFRQLCPEPFTWT